MSWWNAKYKNDHGEYEITFGTKYRERAKAVEKVCQAVIDKVVKAPDDVEVVVRCRECKYFDKNEENDPYCSSVYGLSEPEGDDFCSCGERKEGAD